MNQYDELDRKLESIKNEAEVKRGIMEQVVSEAQGAIEELEAVKQDAEEVEVELQEHITNLEGLQATIEKADRIRDDAETQNITI